MAKFETRRISPQVLDDDIAAADALVGISDFDPRDENYGSVKIRELRLAMQNVQGNETRQEATLKSARDAATAKEWEFHNAMLHVKELLIAQFGNDSNEVQAVGLKKKSEYRAPHRSGATEDAPAVAAK
jgi:hypothetical protein